MQLSVQIHQYDLLLLPIEKRSNSSYGIDLGSLEYCQFASRLEARMRENNQNQVLPNFCAKLAGDQTTPCEP